MAWISLGSSKGSLLTDDSKGSDADTDGQRRGRPPRPGDHRRLAARRSRSGSSRLRSGTTCVAPRPLACRNARDDTRVSSRRARARRCCRCRVCKAAVHAWRGLSPSSSRASAYRSRTPSTSASAAKSLQAPSTIGRLRASVVCNQTVETYASRSNCALSCASCSERLR